MIYFWVKKIRHRLIESHARERHSVKMLWNYHREFGSCFLFEHSLLCQKYAANLNISVLGNVIYCSVGNLTNFQQWKSFENRSRYDEIVAIGWHIFFETQCSCSVECYLMCAVMCCQSFRALELQLKYDTYYAETVDALKTIRFDTNRDVKRSLNFRTSILKFEFDLHTFGIWSSDCNLDRDALPVSRTLRYKLLI